MPKEIKLVKKYRSNYNKFVSDHSSEVDGTPVERMKKLAKLWNENKNRDFSDVPNPPKKKTKKTKKTKKAKKENVASS